MIEKNFNRRAATRRMRVACAAHTRCMSTACVLRQTHGGHIAKGEWVWCREFDD